jgi:2-dehydro-3-deoxygluconokinase
MSIGTRYSAANGARWFHTGGIFCALSETTPEVALEAMQAAHRHGTMVSYDLNYRASLWKAVGGKKRAQAVNRRLAPLVDVMIGNEEDFSAALGFEVAGLDENITNIETAGFERMIETVVKEFPFAVVATTLRKATTASRNDWGALCYCDGAFYQAQNRPDLEIYDRVGGGDGFASGLIYGFLTAADPTVGRGMRRRARRAGHDHSRRYHHGDGVRSAAAHEGQIGPHRKIRGWQLR